MNRLKNFLRATHRRPNRNRNAEAGMTLLEIMIVLAILALVMGLVVGPRVMKMFSSSKVDIARLTAKKFADEAFPTWSMAHPNKGCPDKLEDLSEYMNSEDIKDPWGNPYKMYCGSSLPPGAKGLAVMSIGEDGKEGTGDDVKSWD
jgi:general secretion pathway protein G